MSTAWEGTLWDPKGCVNLMPGDARSASQIMDCGATSHLPSFLLCFSLQHTVRENIIKHIYLLYTYMYVYRQQIRLSSWRCFSSAPWIDEVWSISVAIIVITVGIIITITIVIIHRHHHRHLLRHRFCHHYEQQHYHHDHSSCIMHLSCRLPFFQIMKSCISSVLVITFVTNEDSIKPAVICCNKKSTYQTFWSHWSQHNTWIHNISYVIRDIVRPVHMHDDTRCISGVQTAVLVWPHGERQRYEQDLAAGRFSLLRLRTVIYVTNFL